MSMPQQPGQTKRALRAAREALTRHEGLLATDQPTTYSDALREGYDANTAYERQLEVSWTLDESATLTLIDAAFVGVQPEQTGTPREGDASDTAQRVAEKIAVEQERLVFVRVAAERRGVESFRARNPTTLDNTSEGALVWLADALAASQARAEAAEQELVDLRNVRDGANTAEGLWHAALKQEREKYNVLLDEMAGMRRVVEAAGWWHDAATEAGK